MRQSPQDDLTAPGAAHIHAASTAREISPFALLRLLRSAGRALFAQAALHGQLASVEWQAEKHRLLHMLLAAVLGCVCLLALVLLGSALVLAWSWATPYRMPVVLALLLLHSLGIALAGYRLHRLVARGGPSFAATRAELAADLALFKSTL